MRQSTKNMDSLARAMAVIETPALLVALTTILVIGAAVAIAGPVCFDDEDPIPTTCDRASPPSGDFCPPTILTNPVCGFVNPGTKGSTEFTTYDQRSCVYQPRFQWSPTSPCLDLGDPVTVNFSCIAEHGTLCDNEPE